MSCCKLPIHTLDIYGVIDITSLITPCLIYLSYLYFQISENGFPQSQYIELITIVISFGINSIFLFNLPLLHSFHKYLSHPTWILAFYHSPKTQNQKKENETYQSSIPYNHNRSSNHTIQLGSIWRRLKPDSQKS